MGGSTVLFAEGPLPGPPLAEGVIPEVVVDRLTDDATGVDDIVTEELPMCTEDTAYVVATA